MANTINLNVYNMNGEKLSTLAVSKDVFAVTVNNQVMFDAVMTFTSNSRQATAKTKKRFEVSGGGKKPFRQKGTGRARAGSTRSPIWVGGGTVFGPTGVQNYKIKQNKKEHLLALKSALTLKGKEGILVIDNLETSGKTKDVLNTLNALKVNDKKILVVTSSPLVLQSSRNLPNVILRSHNNISVYDLLNVDKVIVSAEDIKKIEEALK